MNKYIKYIIIAIVIIVLIFVFKPKKIEPTSKITGGGNTPKAGSNAINDMIEALREEPAPVPEVPSFLTNSQIDIVNARREIDGTWTQTLDWADVGHNIKTKVLGSTKANDKRIPLYVGIFKGLNLKATGGNVWRLQSAGIFNRIATSVIDNVIVGEYL